MISGQEAILATVGRLAHHALYRKRIEAIRACLEYETWRNSDELAEYARFLLTEVDRLSLGGRGLGAETAEKNQDGSSS